MLIASYCPHCGSKKVVMHPADPAFFMCENCSKMFEFAEWDIEHWNEV